MSYYKKWKYKITFNYIKKSKTVIVNERCTNNQFAEFLYFQIYLVCIFPEHANLKNVQTLNSKLYIPMLKCLTCMYACMNIFMNAEIHICHMHADMLVFGHCMYMYVVMSEYM